MFTAVAGVIVEPLKISKERNTNNLIGRGALSKSLLGLVCKPDKGTIDLVT